MKSSDISNRREFIRQSCCAAVGTTGMLSAIAQLKAIGAVSADAVRPSSSQLVTDFKALVCIFLSGGNDGTNVIIPYDTASYNSYLQSRSVVALNKTDLLSIKPKTYSDGKSYALTPNMLELKTLFDQGNLAFIGNVGTLVKPTTLSDYIAGTALPNQLYSHLDQTVQWQSSLPDQPVFKTGWGGRLADLLDSLNADHTISMSLALDGGDYFGIGNNVIPYRINSGGVETLNGFYGNGMSSIRYSAIKQMFGSKPDNLIANNFNDTTKTAIDESEFLLNLLNNAPTLKTTFPNSYTASKLKMVATMASLAPSLGLNRQIFFISVGGFDTHTQQMASQPNLIKEVSEAMNAFYNSTIELGLSKQITTFTTSDFGRTYNPNSDGTDHGWGNLQWIMGGAVKGGDIYGKMPSLLVGGNDDTGRGRWIPSTSVDEYNSTLAKWFGVSSTNMSTVLPNIGRFANPDLGFMI